MPTYLSPGVYVEEVDAGSRPIEGVGTAVAAFVGIASQGPFNTPTLVSSWRQFVSTFGEFVDDAYLAHSVYGYFLNGGGNCYVVRIGEEGQVEPLKAELPASGDKGAEQARYEVRAQPSAPLGERLEIEISEPPPASGGGSEGGESGGDGGSVSGSGSGGDTFTLSVLRGGQVVEQFENVTAARGRHSAVTVINQQSQLIQLTDVSGSPAVRPDCTI